MSLPHRSGGHVEESRCHAVRRVVRSRLSCSPALCGRRKELFELPGRSEKYCLECSADVASSILLTIEIDAATMSGQETEGLVAEFVQFSRPVGKSAVGLAFHALSL